MPLLATSVTLALFFVFFLKGRVESISQEAIAPNSLPTLLAQSVRGDTFQAR